MPQMPVKQIRYHCILYVNHDVNVIPFTIQIPVPAKIVTKRKCGNEHLNSINIDLNDSILTYDRKLGDSIYQQTNNKIARCI